MLLDLVVIDRENKKTWEQWLGRLVPRLPPSRVVIGTLGRKQRNRFLQTPECECYAHREYIRKL